MRTRDLTPLIVATLALTAATGCSSSPEPESSASEAPVEQSSAAVDIDPAGTPVTGGVLMGLEATVLSAELEAEPTPEPVITLGPDEIWLGVRYSVENTDNVANTFLFGGLVVYVGPPAPSQGVISVADDNSAGSADPIGPGGTIEFTLYYAVPGSTTLEGSIVCNEGVEREGEDLQCSALA